MRADDAGATSNDGSAPLIDSGTADDGGGASSVADAGGDAGPVGSGTSGWTLTFNDEFDGPVVDTCKWQFRLKSGERVVNHELQAYVSQANESQAFTFNNGILSIVGSNQPGIYGGQTLAYTSGLLTSIYVQKYGFFQTRSRMPKGSGLWPAFWLLHTTGYPDINEIDIMEWISGTSTVVYMTDHFGTSYATNSLQDQFKYTSPDVSDAFHTYGVDWEIDRIVYYVDGREIGRITDAAQLHSTPMYVITNLAIGGDFPGAPLPSAVFPVFYDVDFIRVYQLDGSNPAPPPPSDFPASLPDAGPCPSARPPPPPADAAAGTGIVDHDAGPGASEAGVAPLDAGASATAAHPPLARSGCICSNQAGGTTSLFGSVAAFGGALGALLRRRLRKAKEAQD